MKERANEREGAAGKRTRRGRMEIAQACNKSRYRSLISLERALARNAARGREMEKGREGSECRLREAGPGSSRGQPAKKEFLTAMTYAADV